MSVTTKSSPVTTSAAPPRPLGLTPAQREALQKFTVWRNSFDDRGDLFGGTAITSMLLQDIVGELARAADELCNIAHKPAPNRLSFADVTKIVADLLVPINDGLGKLQGRIDALEQATSQNQDRIEAVNSHLSHSIAQAMQQIERMEEHLRRQDRDREALRERLDSLTGHVERFVAEADWELIRSLISLGERVKRLEDAEPHREPQPARGRQTRS
jgi:methyl-accepting chemotaxis protein